MSSRTQSAIESIREGYILHGIEELKKSVLENDVNAQFFMGRCYENGIGVKQNYQEAFKLYRKTAERGLPDAMYHLAFFIRKAYLAKRITSKVRSGSLATTRKVESVNCPISLIYTTKD